jgi:hypothetical protein
MKRVKLATILSMLVASGIAFASSHREAPLITTTPKVDATDFYMFRSYQTGREGYVTLLANYIPLQDAYGGPNYFQMDPRALYAIHVDADGDALPDRSFYFRFYNTQRNLTVPAGGQDIPVPLVNIGPFGTPLQGNANRNVLESYVVVSERDGQQSVATNLSRNTTMFDKPSDNIGNKSIRDYASYANRHITRIGVDGCAGEGRVFVGQRNDGFAVNLGEVFDLVNTNPVGPPNGETNVIANKNVTTIALELPIACLTKDSEPVIGAWTAAYLPNAEAEFTQVSRLSAPLVNEVVIGLPDKDRFNASLPVDDAQFARYVTNPSLPILLQALFGVQAPTSYPRTDLVAAFLTGLDGLNKPANVRPAEMMRLNTTIAPRPAASQSNLGALGGDTAGFPNGRRPGDDVVDIELRVAMGVLLPQEDAPSGQLPYTDGATVNAGVFRSQFPYLNTPIAGSPSN